MKLLVVNNRDSFTYNLVELVRQLNVPYQVVNVEVMTEDTPRDFSHILISPGPDVPSAYPQLFKLLQNTYREKSILGVCLGLQTLGQFFGAHLYNLATPRHGLQSQIKMLVKTRMWQALPEQFKVGLYHSWARNGLSTSEIANFCCAVSSRILYVAIWCRIIAGMVVSYLMNLLAY